MILLLLLMGVVRFESAAECEAAEWERGVGKEEESMKVCGCVFGELPSASRAFAGSGFDVC